MNTTLIFVAVAALAIWKLTAGLADGPPATDPAQPAGTAYGVDNLPWHPGDVLGGAPAAFAAVMASLRLVPAFYAAAANGTQYQTGGRFFVIWNGKAVPLEKYEDFTALRVAAGQ
jgi:hypothetical protein